MRPRHPFEICSSICRFTQFAVSNISWKIRFHKLKIQKLTSFYPTQFLTKYHKYYRYWFPITKWWVLDRLKYSMFFRRTSAYKKQRVANINNKSWYAFLFNTCVCWELKHNNNLIKNLPVAKSDDTREAILKQSSLMTKYLSLLIVEFTAR